jgi:hypothetical protein
MFHTLFRMTCFVMLAGLTLVACAPEEAASLRAATLASPTDEAERPLGPDVASGEEVQVATPPLASVPVPGATVLAQGLQLKYEEPNPRFFVIADDGAWADFWQTYTPEGQTASPPVDFGTSFVLVGVQGVKSTGGYNITFSDLRQSGDEVHVVTDLREPAPGESAEMAFTQPYIIVQVESAHLTTRGPLTFIFETAAGQELGRVTQTLASPADEAERPLGPDVASGEEVQVATPPLASVPIPGATVLAQGLQLKYDDPQPRFFVIADDGAWVDFWQTYTPEGQTASPPVDFGTSFVLVGVQGVKSTGGYSITFSDLRQSGDKVHVVTDLREPAPGESAEMAFTQPYIIVQVESARLTTRGPLTFIFETAAGQELGRVTQIVAD